MRRNRGFSLMEVLLAIAIVGGGIISLLLIRSNAIQMASESIRLRSTRLLAADQAGHALAVGLSTTLQSRDPGEGFEEFRVERVVEEVAFEELLPEELVERALSDPEGPGAPSGGSQQPGSAAEGEGGLLMRRLVVIVYPPGAEDDPSLQVTIVTYQLDEPDTSRTTGRSGSGGGSGGSGGNKEANFPEQLPPLVGPDAVGPPGSGTSEGTGEGSGEGNPEGNPPGGGGG